MSRMGAGLLPKLVRAATVAALVVAVFPGPGAAGAPSDGAPSVELAWAEVTLQGCDLRAEVEVTLVGSSSANAPGEGRLWLEFRVSDGSGETLFHSGAPSAVGSAGAGSRIEPHHAVVLAEREVQIYERRQAPDGDRGTLKDNRLWSRGPEHGQTEASPAVGRAARDSDFERHGDTVVYAIDLAGSVGPYEVEAALHHQPSPDPQENGRGAGGTAEADALPSVVARIRTSIE